MGGIIANTGAGDVGYSEIRAWYPTPLRAWRHRRSESTKGAMDVESTAIAHQVEAGTCQFVPDGFESTDLARMVSGTI